MKIIENTCHQPRRYADSEGWLKIELEPGDNRDEIIQKYHHEKTNICDKGCIFQEKLSTDTLLVFEQHQTFLD